MIHHYTSIQTLALILKSKKIRFSRLDQVDDIKEIAGFPTNFGTYLFISCWTEDDTENIALWKMYTENMKGVRISLPQQMFKTTTIKSGDYDGYILDQDIVTPLPLEKIRGENYFIINHFGLEDGFYKKIVYDATSEQKYRALFAVEDQRLLINGIQHLGKYKDPLWEFQKESRFALCVAPMLPLSDHRVNNDKRRQLDLIPELLIQQQSNSFNYIDLDLDETTLDNIKVRLGPFCQFADTIIVESLLKDYTANGTVEESSLRAVIRR